MSKATKKKVVKSSFKDLVDATPDIASGYNVGLKALGDHSKLISLTDSALCEGSVEIDECTKRKYPAANRWDYVFSYSGFAYFVEVHSAETGEVSTVLRKLQWLKDWLNVQAPEINKTKAKVPYYWIQSGRYSIQSNSPQFRQAVKAGLKPIPRLSI